MGETSVVIISGGTFGLGHAIAVELAQRGHRVVAFGLSAPQPSSVASGFANIEADIARGRLSIDVLEADVSNPVDVARVAAHSP